MVDAKGKPYQFPLKSFLKEFYDEADRRSRAPVMSELYRSPASAEVKLKEFKDTVSGDPRMLYLLARAPWLDSLWEQLLTQANTTDPNFAKLQTMQKIAPQVMLKPTSS